MQRAILTHEEKSIDEMMIHTIMKQGSHYQPVHILLFIILVGKQYDGF